MEEYDFLIAKESSLPRQTLFRKKGLLKDTNKMDYS